MILGEFPLPLWMGFLREAASNLCNVFALLHYFFNDNDDGGGCGNDDDDYDDEDVYEYISLVPLMSTYK